MSILKNFSSNSVVVSTPSVPKSRADGYTGLGCLWAQLRRIFHGLGRRAVFGGALEHLGSLPLTAHASVALVRLRNETLLLGITSHTITLLSKGSDETKGGSATMTVEPIKLHEKPLPRAEDPAR